MTRKKYLISLVIFFAALLLGVFISYQEIKDKSRSYEEERELDRSKVNILKTNYPIK